MRPAVSFISSRGRGVVLRPLALGLVARDVVIYFIDKKVALLRSVIHKVIFTPVQGARGQRGSRCQTCRCQTYDVGVILPGSCKLPHDDLSISR